MIKQKINTLLRPMTWWYLRKVKIIYAMLRQCTYFIMKGSSKIVNSLKTETKIFSQP